METTGAGTVVMVAIAAGLWFFYFVPTWMRRREYLATERTATRLQQTLRIMAETAELPEQVRVEVNARDAARQERVLQARERRADALAARQAAALLAAMPPAPPVVPSSRSAAVRVASAGAPVSAHLRARRRRARVLASTLLAAGTVTIGVQLWLVVTSGAVLGSWFVVAGGAAIGFAGVGVRRRLDARRAPVAVASPRAAQPVIERAPQAVVERSSGWTPVPVPAPLYLSRPATQRLEPAPDLVAQLRAAALASERALRDAHDAPEVVPFRPQRSQPSHGPAETPASRPATASPAVSRWASMGRVEGSDAAAPDLDEVLRRRRSAG